jgi:hypothetical protein
MRSNKLRALRPSETASLGRSAGEGREGACIVDRHYYNTS